MQPQMSQIINAHSGLILVLLPPQRFDILILCVTSFDSGHNLAAISFLYTFIPLSLALAIASSILKFFILHKLFFRHNVGIYKHIHLLQNPVENHNPCYYARNDRFLQLLHFRHIPHILRHPLPHNQKTL